MDLLDLDERLEKNIKHLEMSLVEYEKLMSEASYLKYTFENQMKELMAAYEEKIVILFKDIELKNDFFDSYMHQINEAYEEKWQDIQIQNKNNLADLDGKVNEKINKLETENKKELMKIINSLKASEKVIVHSKKEVTEFISDEVYKLLGERNVIDKSIETINSDISKIKSESERSLIDFSGELFKETIRVDNKNKELEKNFKIFMAISSVLFIILLIWR